MYLKSFSQFSDAKSSATFMAYSSLTVSSEKKVNEFASSESDSSDKEKHDADSKCFSGLL
jgi:hypothetical protein